jgi:hypothetical protein
MRKRHGDPQHSITVLRASRSLARIKQRHATLATSTINIKACRQHALGAIKQISITQQTRITLRAASQGSAKLVTRRPHGGLQRSIIAAHGSR